MRASLLFICSLFLCKGQATNDIEVYGDYHSVPDLENDAEAAEAQTYAQASLLAAMPHEDIDISTEKVLRHNLNSSWLKLFVRVMTDAHCSTWCHLHVRKRDRCNHPMRGFTHCYYTEKHTIAKCKRQVHIECEDLGGFKKVTYETEPMVSAVMALVSNNLPMLLKNSLQQAKITGLWFGKIEKKISFMTWASRYQLNVQVTTKSGSSPACQVWCRLLVDQSPPAACVKAMRSRLKNKHCLRIVTKAEQRYENCARRIARSKCSAPREQEQMQTGS